MRADVALLDARDWRHLAYHFAGDVVHTVVSEGRIAFTELQGFSNETGEMTDPLSGEVA